MVYPRILIAADEPTALDLRRRLARIGFEPLADVRLAEETVTLAEQLRPDLVLLELPLEGELDGIAVAQNLLDRLDIPVVLLTTGAGEETLDSAKRREAFASIARPFTERELRLVIEMALFKHQAATLREQGCGARAAAFRTTLDGFWLVDLSGRILDTNEACCRMLGYTRAEMLEKSLTDFEADETGAEVAATSEQIRQAGATQFERRHRTKSGQLIDVGLSISYVAEESGKFSVFLRDITEHKRDEALLDGQKQVLEMIAAGAALAGTLDKLVRVIEARAPEMLCSILLLDADGVHLRHGAAPSLPGEFVQAIDGVAIGPSVGSCGTAAFRRQAVVVEDIATDALWADYRELALPHGLRACWCTPIFDPTGKVLGTFAMYYQQPGRPTAQHERLIEIATQAAAIAIGRENTDRALRTSEERYRDLVDNSLELISTQDLEGNFLSVNETTIRITGNSRETLLRMNIADLLVPETRHLFPEYLRILRASGRARGIMRIQTANGERRFWEYDTTVRTEGVAVPVVRAMALDITERLRSEKALRASESQLQVILESTEDGILAVDRRGRILKTNRRFAELWRIPPSSMGGADDQALLDQVLVQLCEPAAFLEKVRALYASDVADLDEIHFKDGRCFERFSAPMLEGSAVVGRVWSFRDITEREGTERALRENEDRYRDLVENSREVIATYDLEGNFISVNETAIRNTGYPRETFLKLNLADLVVPEFRHRVPEFFDTLRAVGQVNGIIRIQTANGERRTWEHTTTLRTAGVPVPVVRGMALDITERLRSERALRASHERFELANRAMFNVLWDWNLATDAFWRNDNFRTLFGYEREEVEASSAAAYGLIHPEDLLGVQAGLKVARESRSEFWSDQYRFRRKDGSYATVEDRAVISRNADGCAIRMLGAMQDISERVQAEAALRASEERHRLLADNASDVIWTMDLDGRFTYISPSVERLRGYTVSEMMQQSMEEVLVPGSAAIVRAEFGRALAALGAGEPFPEFRAELEQFCKDGGTVWTEVTTTGMRNPAGELMGILGITRNISERKRAEASLRLQGGALQAAANTIVITDRQGLIEWANLAFTSATGYGVDEAIGKRPGDLLRSGHQDTAFYAALWKAILAGEVWHGELVNRRKDGSLYTEEMTITPLKDHSGEISHFVAVKQDVTERKLLEQKFLQAQKLEAVGRLAGGVAHDFNNMLGVILGYVDLALGEVKSSEPLHADLLEIQRAAGRSADLTRQLLAFARRETITPRVMDLNETVAGMLSMLTRLIGEDIRVTWMPGVALWPVLMDPSQVDQLLANLCVNARDAIAGVGAIVIATANCAVDAADCAGQPDAEPGEYVRLSVSDTGGGMDQETLARIFEPFFTTKAVGEGTGLGLAMVYGVVKQNRGFLRVSSAPRQGSVFEVYLPRERRPAERARKLALAAPAARGHETVLLVEDEPAILKLTRRMLETQGYKVLAAATPGAALALARGHGDEIHLLLTDVVMPEMNGRDLAKGLLALHPRLKCLFMSGYTAEVIAHGGVLAEGTQFLQKPFTLVDLVARLRAALDRE